MEGRSGGVVADREGRIMRKAPIVVVLLMLGASSGASSFAEEPKVEEAKPADAPAEPKADAAPEA